MIKYPYVAIMAMLASLLMLARQAQCLYTAIKPSNNEKFCTKQGRLPPLLLLPLLPLEIALMTVVMAMQSCIL